jgi:hypothetical protein
MSSVNTESVSGEAPPANAAAGPPHTGLVLCRLPGGDEIVTTPESCQGAGGVVISQTAPANSKSPVELVLCRLPGGDEIVTTPESCAGSGGTVVSRHTVPVVAAPVSP